MKGRGTDSAHGAIVVVAGDAVGGIGEADIHVAAHVVLGEIGATGPVEEEGSVEILFIAWEGGREKASDADEPAQ